MVDIESMTIEELTAYIGSIGEKPFRAKQLYEWMHKKLAADFDEMTNLPKSLRERLTEEASLETLHIETVQTSKEDGTKKYLFRAKDGEYIESVRMVYKHGVSVCVSSQIGCRMGCKFCASTRNGLSRNLTAGEILEQVYRIERDTGERVSHVVVMGMGEPFDNYDAVVRFLRLISDENGLNIGQRNLTVSTCGLVPGIDRFAEEGLQVTLALSLHASTQEKRLELMPIAKSYEIREVVAACRRFFETTGRRITFEYAMAAGVNDSAEDARALRDLIGDMNCHINLIPINPVTESGFRETPREAVEAFRVKLEKYGINGTIRRELGRDIDGACGQLRARYRETGEDDS